MSLAEEIHSLNVNNFQFDCNPSPSAPTYPELQSEMYNLWTAPTVPDDMWPLFLQGDPPLYDPFSQYMLGLEFSVFNTDVSPALATNFMQLNPRFV